MNTDKTKPNEEPITDVSVLFTRMVWLFLGPITMIVLLIKIIEAGSGWATGLDGAFFVTLLVTIAARWREFQKGSRVALDGAPATSQVLRAYATRTAFIGVLAWVIGNLLGNHWLQ